MRDFHGLGEEGCEGHIHTFFGRMSGVWWGETQYKHLDHHLRQFGARRSRRYCGNANAKRRTSMSN